MPLVCRYKPNRSRPRLFGLKDLERVSCAIFENGQGTPQQIRDACEKCLPPDEEECQEERELIERVAPLLFAGLATLALAVPVVRAVAVVGRFATIARTAIQTFLRRIPWLNRFFPTAGQAGTTSFGQSVASFEAAQAALSPQYVSAIATTARILNKLQKRLEVTGPLLFLLSLAGVAVEEFQQTEEDA